MTDDIANVATLTADTVATDVKADRPTINTLAIDVEEATTLLDTHGSLLQEIIDFLHWMFPAPFGGPPGKVPPGTPSALKPAA